MAKSKKKRNKKYSGADAKSNANVIRVHKVAAVSRSDRAQWFYDHRKAIKRTAIIALISAAVIFFIVEVIITLAG